MLDGELKPNGPEAAHLALRGLAALSFTAGIILTHREAMVLAHRSRDLACCQSPCGG